MGADSEGTNGEVERLDQELERLVRHARAHGMRHASQWLEQQLAARRRLIGRADDFEVVHHPSA